MLGYDANQVRNALEEQIQDFEELGVLQHIKRILAYPYGVPPLEEGIEMLKEYHFVGAFLAYPGVGEAKYSSIPVCTYDSKPLGSAFKIPRVSIGAYCYPPYVEGKQSAFIPIDPIKHFQKNVIENTANIYISKGV